MLLKLSVRSAGREFQIIVGAAWQNARLPKTVLDPASWLIDMKTNKKAAKVNY